MLNVYCSVLKLILLTASLLLLSHFAQATHIVGGELELRYIGPQGSNTYRINLNLYFDLVNGDPKAKDQVAYVGVFAKRTNQFLGYVVLSQTGYENVVYTKPACQDSRLSTQLIRYSTDLTLDPNVFNDAGGYYLSWERCCRNSTIVNIQHPEGAGSAFYLEFPALVNGSSRVYNSSPVFTVPKGDYACIGQPFTLDFGAKDADGDSLAYALVTPYNGFSSSATTNSSPGANGTFNPGPYPPVQWVSSLSTTNEIPGSAPLQVNGHTGLLSVTPNRAGLFVFSVEVTEYRNKKAIGLVRRDYQVLVLDCPRNDPPQLLFRPDGQKAFYKPGTVVTLTEKDTNCLTLYVTDINPNQHITVTNMSGSLPGLSLAPNQLTTRTNHDTLQTKFCFGRCVSADGKPFTLLIRATDDGCPQGLSDTITIRLAVTSPLNHKPAAGTDLMNNQGKVNVGSSLTFTAFGTDVDNDNVTIQAVGRGFTLAQAGMKFSSASGSGKVAQPFLWTPTCSQATQSDYLVDFIVTDTRCSNNLRDTVTVRLSAVGLSSRPPSVRTTLTQATVELTVSPSDTVGRTSFDVLGNDPDRDSIRLTGTGRGFDTKSVGMVFTNKTGLPTLQSPFTWKPDCALMTGKTDATFVVDFVVDDHSCQPHHTDTTTVTFHVKNPSITTDIKVPNVFTPNGDGFNDYFAVNNLSESTCYEQFRRIDITNRWGALIFSSTDPKFRWYGTDSPVGTYYYLLLTSSRSFKGTVTLMR